MLKTWQVAVPPPVGGLRRGTGTSKNFGRVEKERPGIMTSFAYLGLQWQFD
ncbi:MAG: hypothetical protein HW390_1963 [Candidatus Brocadiaceae bacterium]|nr:hypothetical protein [Candidatus Brocadiaceae bacterium]